MDESQLQKRDQQSAAPSRQPGAEADMRASDADRDRVADILRDALAEGRLTTEEHSERIESLYATKTLGELEPLTRDLPVPGGYRVPAPAAGPAAQAPARAESPELVAVFGGASRKGRWRVGGRTRAVAVFGGVEIDLTEAVYEQREVVIHATAVFGGVEITVPENVGLRGGGTGIFGGFDVRGHEAEDAGAPIVEVRGFALFGGVAARRKRGKRIKELSDGSGHRLEERDRKRIDG